MRLLTLLDPIAVALCDIQEESSLSHFVNLIRCTNSGTIPRRF